MKFVGFFRELMHGKADRLPSLLDARDKLESKLVPGILAHLSSGQCIIDIMEFVQDPFQPNVTGFGGAMPGVPGGSSLETDGIWIWRYDLAYFIENYRIRLPKDFIEHVLIFNPDSIKSVTSADNLERYLDEYKSFMKEMKTE